MAFCGREGVIVRERLRSWQSGAAGCLKLIRHSLTDRISAAKALRDGRRAAYIAKDKARRPEQVGAPLAAANAC